MRIHKIRLFNFRAFDDRVFELPAAFTVLIGENGSGKTAFLDAAAIAAGTIFVGIDTERARPPGIQSDDVRRKSIRPGGGRLTLEPQLPVIIAASGSLEDGDWAGAGFVWNRTRETLLGKTTWAGASTLVDLARTWMQKTRAGEDVSLPLIAYYGTGRLWRRRRAAGKGDKVRGPGSRLAGYADCLDPDSDHREFVEWFRRMELINLQRGPVHELEAVKTAVKACLPDIQDLRFDVEEAEPIAVATDGRELPFRMWSDGYRNMLGMVADIAHRAAILNPHLGADAAKKTTGIVLIDEIDLHLHPKWQRRVVDDLKTAFPRLQFIATTHSPFIIQSLRDDELINLDDERREAAYGRSIEDIAEAIMGIPVPQRSERHRRMMEAAKEYYSALEEAKTASPERLAQLKERLDELSAPFSDDVAYHAFLETKRAAARLPGNRDETH